jgi:preprotein translocase subunit SecE
MTEKARAIESGGDTLKWAIVTVLVVAGIYGNSYFADLSWLYRLLALLGLSAVAVLVAAKTVKGQAFIALGIEAKTEIRKVVWPTREETTHTTIIVVIAVLVLALVLYALDSSLSWLLKALLGI